MVYFLLGLTNNNKILKKQKSRNTYVRFHQVCMYQELDCGIYITIKNFTGYMIQI